MRKEREGDKEEAAEIKRMRLPEQSQEGDEGMEQTGMKRDGHEQPYEEDEPQLPWVHGFCLELEIIS